MSSSAPLTTRPVGREILDRLRDQTAELGINFQVFSPDGEPAGEFRPDCALCAVASPARRRCAGEMAALAADALSAEAPIHRRTSLGCCVLGTPIWRRRRVTGAAVACYPPRELLDEEALARFCDAAQLDRRAAEPLAKKACRHHVSQAPDLLSTLGWMVRREQELQTAEAELSNLSTNLSTTYEELSLLYRISGSVRVTQSPRDFLRTTCEELLEVMHVETVAAVVYAHPPAIEKELVVTAGRPLSDDDELADLVKGRLARRFAEGERTIVDNHFVEVAGGARVRNLVAVPLMTDEGATGALLALNKETASSGAGEFDSVDLKLLNSIGNQAGVFLTNNRLYAELQDLLMGVLHALTESIDAKDPYTCGHSRRVAMISKRIAEAHGLDEAAVQQVYLAGLLHDIGKIGVPEEVLLKSGRLSDEEFEKVKRHPLVGARILRGIRHLDGVIDGILTHHERPDGNGYPCALRNGDIPVEGLIVGLADSFDAMTSDRTYRKALPLDEAVAEIRRNAVDQFRQDIVESFLTIDLPVFLKEIRQPGDAFHPVSLLQDAARRRRATTDEEDEPCR